MMSSELQTAILEAVISLSNIPFAPQEPHQQEKLMYAIAAFADRPDALAWTVDVAVAKWRRWLGVAELRAIYCTKFKPADGIEEEVIETTGFRPSDNETAYLLEQARETDRQLAAWKRQAALLPAGERIANQALQRLQPRKLT